MIELYTYYRSTAAYRVRIALNYKGLEYQTKPVHLLKAGGEQHKNNYKNLNPQGLVPTLIHDGNTIMQSLAIIEYLEEKFKTPALLPETAEERAFVRSLALIVACDIHPINNLRVLTYLTEALDVSEENKKRWYANWVTLGFQSIEAMLAKKDVHEFCYGNSPTIADICLIPQVYNAIRFNIDLNPFPHIRNVYDHCLTLPYFDEAKPESQPDA